MQRSLATLNSGFVPRPPSSARLRWLAVSVFALAAACNYLDRQVLSAAAPQIKAEFHLTNTQYGWLGSAFGLAYAAASPAVGWFLDWLGLEAGIVCAVAMWSVAAGLCGLTRSFGQLMAGRAFLGAWESAGVPAAGKLNAIYLEPKNRALGAAMTQVGIALAGVGGPLLVRSVAGWRTAVFAAAALGFLWIPLWLLTRRSISPWEAVPPRRKESGPGLLGDRRLLILAAANVLWMGVYVLWTNWTTLYLVQQFRLTPAQANGYAWFPPVASVVGGFAGGWISRAAIGRGFSHVDARVLVTMLSAVGCLATVLLPFCRTPFLAVLVMAFSYFWALAGSVNIYTIPVDIWGGERAGAAIAALVCAYGLLQTVISPLIGTLVDHFGYTPVFWLVALPPMGGWLLLRTLRTGRTAAR
jgi:ACS family hexuronate transporter-like MFS transporter